MNVRDEDGCGVVVLLAAPGGSVDVGLGELRLARPADEILGAVGGEEVEQLWPVDEAKALDESGGAVAEERGAPKRS